MRNASWLPRSPALRDKRLSDESLLKEHVRVELKRFIQKLTGARPVIMPVVVQVYSFESRVCQVQQASSEFVRSTASSLADETQDHEPELKLA